MNDFLRHDLLAGDVQDFGNGSTVSGPQVLEGDDVFVYEPE